jgi:hypothetical protein
VQIHELILVSKTENDNECKLVVYSKELGFCIRCIIATVSLADRLLIKRQTKKEIMAILNTGKRTAIVLMAPCFSSGVVPFFKTGNISTESSAKNMEMEKKKRSIPRAAFLKCQLTDGCWEMAFATSLVCRLSFTVRSFLVISRVIKQAASFAVHLVSQFNFAPVKKIYQEKVRREIHPPRSRPSRQAN